MPPISMTAVGCAARTASFMPGRGGKLGEQSQSQSQSQNLTAKARRRKGPQRQCVARRSVASPGNVAHRNPGPPRDFRARMWQPACPRWVPRREKARGHRGKPALGTFGWAKIFAARVPRAGGPVGRDSSRHVRLSIILVGINPDPQRRSAPQTAGSAGPARPGATRRPMTPPRSAGTSWRRNAERTSRPPPNQEPPRSTRPLPWGGPSGSVLGAAE